MFAPLVWLLGLGAVKPNNTRADAYYAVAVLLVETVGTFITLNFTNYNELDEVLIFTDPINTVLDFLAGIWIVRKVYVSKEALKEIIDKCLAFNGLENQSSIYEFVFELSTVFVFVSLFSARVVFRTDKVEVVYDIVMALIYIPTLLHIVLVFHLKARFSALNARLREAAHNLHSSDLRAQLATLFQSHVHLRHVQNQMNELFSLYNTICVFNRVVYFTIETYYFISLLEHPVPQVDMGDAFELLSCLIAILSQCNMSHICSEKVKYYAYI